MIGRLRIDANTRLHAIGVVTLLSLVLLPFIARAMMSSGWTWPCLFKAVTGIPCPTCGGTRALAALSHLHFLQALKYNPLVVLAPFVAFVFALTPLRLNGKAAWLAFCGAFLVNWFYLICFLPR